MNAKEQEQIVEQKVNLELIEYRIAGKLFLEKESLITLAKHIHGDDKAILVSGTSFFTQERHERCKWIKEEVLPKAYSVNSIELPSKEKPIYFSYVKFATTSDKKVVFGIQSGKSQFYLGYYSDISFWNIDSERNGDKYLKRFMKENNLSWYEDEILIIKANEFFENADTEVMNKKFESKAYYNEKNIGWGLFS